MSYPFKTQEEARAFIRKVMGPPKRELEGKEYDHIWTLLQLIDPVHSSNNQRTWTDEYHLNGKKYDVTFGLGEQPIIEELEIEIE